MANAMTRPGVLARRTILALAFEVGAPRNTVGRVDVREMRLRERQYSGERDWQPKVMN